MAHNGQTFESPRSAKIIGLISDTLVARGGATTTDLAVVTGLTSVTVGAYLTHMDRLGLAHCAVAAIKIHRGSIPAQWAPGKGTSDATKALSGVRRRVIVRKEWAPHHARSAMDCLLFGTPSILRTVP